MSKLVLHLKRTFVSPYNLLSPGKYVYQGIEFHFGDRVHKFTSGFFGLKSHYLDDEEYENIWEYE